MNGASKTHHFGPLLLINFSRGFLQLLLDFLALLLGLSSVLVHPLLSDLALDLGIVRLLVVIPGLALGLVRTAQF